MGIPERRRVRLGEIYADLVTFGEALDAIEELVWAGAGGFVVTPNVDHVVMAERNVELRAAYGAASLSLVDGMPLLWVTRLLGVPLPEKISGADLIRPVLRRAAARGMRVYLLGGAPGIALRAARVLTGEIPELRIVGVDAPTIALGGDGREAAEALSRMLALRPDLVLLALGAPKQELLMHRWFGAGITPVMLGIGAGLDFIAGKVARAPRWISEAGLEWLFRLCQEPRRLADRYLIRDSAILPIFYRMWCVPKESRSFPLARSGIIDSASKATRKQQWNNKATAAAESPVPADEPAAFREPVGR